jgi:hypothetical protein
MPDWNGRCHRCGEPSTMYTMSYLNTQLICMDCDDKEKEHPRYKDAKAEELEQVTAGNMNYKGLLYGRKT